MTSSDLFVLRDVSVLREGRALLDHISTAIPEGRITVLFGPSGAGKSRLLRLLNRLDEVTAGEIRYRGKPLPEIPVHELRCRVGFVAQTPVLFPGRVRDNFLEAAVLAGLSQKEAGERMRTAATLAGLAPSLLERDGTGLSGGERQRVVIGRALVSRPETLLLDEPTSALDRVTAGHLLETLQELRDREKLTVVLTTHRLEEIRGIADHAIMLQAGEVVEVGDADRLFADPREEATRAFIGWVRERGDPAS